MKPIKTMLFVITLISLASCQNATEVMPVSSTIGLATPTATDISTQNSTTTRYLCPAFLPTIPENTQITGHLFLDGNPSYYFDFSGSELQMMPEHRYHFAVSPDGLWLAYVEASRDSPTGWWLVVENATGPQARVVFLHDDWFVFIDPMWLGNTRLVYNLNSGISSGIYSVVIIDPFTGDTQELESNYPGILRTDGVLHFVYSTVVYEPSLDLVIYPETTEEGNFIVLWDRHNQVAIARLQTGSWFAEHAPRWLPDGNHFVIAAQVGPGIDEWFSVSQDGEIHQLTRFENTFEQTDIGAYGISSDGKYLAFWLRAEPSDYNGQHLAVLDLESLQVIEYCLPGSIQNDARPPVWSPDNRYIVIENYYETYHRHVMLVDTIGLWSTIIAEDLIPSGWMISPVTNETPPSTPGYRPTVTLQPSLTYVGTATSGQAEPTRPTTGQLPTPNGVPVTSWRGIPIMETAIAGEEKLGADQYTQDQYWYTVDASLEEVRVFYENEMPEIGWLYFSDVSAPGLLTMFYQKDSDMIAISIIGRDPIALVVISWP